MKSIFFFLICACALGACNTTFKDESVHSLESMDYDSFRLVLENIYMKDQTLRANFGCLDKKYKSNSDNVKYYWSIVEEQDSLNLIIVEDIINNYGWLGRSEVGAKANKAMFLVIQHGNLKTQEKYFHLLKESVLGGESMAEDYALMHDRILMRNGKKQEFGTQIKYNKESGIYEVYPIRDIQNTNSRRIEIGLDSIHNYLDPYGITLK